MPIYVGYSQKRRTVRLLSAGGSQYLLCPPTDIELAADISDLTNVRNHTFLWEQISGPAVILASTDTPGTSFPFADTQDKVFRFYIDPGTNREQYKDVNVFYTPTSVHSQLVVSSADPFQKSMTTPNLTQQAVYLLAQPSGLVDANVLVTPATTVSFDPVDYLGLLIKTVKLEILTDAGYVIDPEDVYATYDYAFGTFKYEYDLPNGVYRFRFHYDLGTVDPTVVTSPLVICNTTASAEDAWAVDDVITYSNVGLTPTLSGLVRFTITREAAQSDFDGPVGLGGGLLNAQGGFYDPAIDPPPILQLTPRLIEAPEYPALLDSNSWEVIQTGLLSGVVRLDPSNIGN